MDVDAAARALVLTYTLTSRGGPLDGLVAIPRPGDAGLVPTELWKHTCFEAFIARGPARKGPYSELNFSPAGLWQGFTFEGYREGGVPTLSDIPASLGTASRAKEADGGESLVQRVTLPLRCARGRGGGGALAPCPPPLPPPLPPLKSFIR